MQRAQQPTSLLLGSIYLVGVSAIAVAAAASAAAAAAAAELRRRLKSCVLNKNVLRRRSSIHASFSFRRVNFNLKTKPKRHTTHARNSARSRLSFSFNFEFEFVFTFVVCCVESEYELNATAQ